MLKQIAFEDPLLLRKLNRPIPAELETIVEKSIRKSPAERYATCCGQATANTVTTSIKPAKATSSLRLLPAVVDHVFGPTAFNHSGTAQNANTILSDSLAKFFASL